MSRSRTDDDRTRPSDRSWTGESRGDQKSERGRNQPVEALHAASGNQAVQRAATGASDSTERAATDASRDPATAMCDRCVRRFEAGKPLNCDECEAALRSTDGGPERATADGAVQPKLRVSSPNDAAEREAERVTDEVSRPTNDREREREDASGPDDVTVERRVDGGRDATVDVDVDTERTVEKATTGGNPLPDSTRSVFERRFGRDFSDVRVHTGSRADEAARSLDAEAFTLGSDVVFADGAYQPDTADGRALLAHELTHVVQQGGAPETVARQAAGAEERNRAEDGQNARFRDCTEEVAEVSNPAGKLASAAGRGARAATQAVSAIETYVQSDEPDESVRRAFAVHFSMPDNDQMQEITATFREAQSVLANPGSFPGEFICNTADSVYCSSEQHGAHAYVLRTEEMRQTGQEGAYIHICPSVFSHDRPLWNILLHEAVHVVGKGRDCYRGEGCYAALSSAESVENADSYAGFAHDT